MVVIFTPSQRLHISSWWTPWPDVWAEAWVGTCTCFETAALNFWESAVLGAWRQLDTPLYTGVTPLTGFLFFTRPPPVFFFFSFYFTKSICWSGILAPRGAAFVSGRRCGWEQMYFSSHRLTLHPGHDSYCQDGYLWIAFPQGQASIVDT